MISSFISQGAFGQDIRRLGNKQGPPPQWGGGRTRSFCLLWPDLVDGLCRILNIPVQTLGRGEPRQPRRDHGPSKLARTIIRDDSVPLRAFGKPARCSQDEFPKQRRPDITGARMPFGNGSRPCHSGQDWLVTIDHHRDALPGRTAKRQGIGA